MKAIKIGTNRLISVVLSLIMCATILTGAIWALSNLFKTGMSIVVTYDAPLDAKVYLSTDSTGAELAGLRQPGSDNIVTVNNFNKANSALVLNTTGNNENGNAKTKGQFEALGKDSTSLICDANGEMQFYVYVENFSTEDSVYYRANITFGNEEETTPFSVVKNPSYAVSEAVSDSTGGGVTSSLLAFKIKANDLNAGIKSDKIIIKIELKTDLLSIMGLGGKYTSGDFKGMYFIEMGRAPQNFAGTINTISAIETGEYWVDGNEYFTNTANPNIKYVKNGDNYYLVEPVRWIVIADENFSTENGTFGIDYYSNIDLVQIDKTKLSNIPSRQIVVLSENILTTFSFTYHFNNYSSQMTSLRNGIFNSNEQILLNNFPYYTNLNKWGMGDLTENFSLLAGYSSSENFYYSTYLTTTDLRKASNTAYLDKAISKPSSYNEYWTRSRWASYGSTPEKFSGYYLNSTGALIGQQIYGGDFPSQGIRPMIIVNLEL